MITICSFYERSMINRSPSIVTCYLHYNLTIVPIQVWSLFKYVLPRNLFFYSYNFYHRYNIQQYVHISKLILIKKVLNNNIILLHRSRIPCVGSNFERAAGQACTSLIDLCVHVECVLQ